MKRRLMRGTLVLILAASLGAVWPSYRGDLHNSGAAFGPEHVARLTLTRGWTYRSKSWITSTPTVGNGMVYAGTWNGGVVALDERSGRRRWSASLGSNPDRSYGQPRGVIGSIALAQGRAFAVSGDCVAAAFDARDGHALWRRNICSNRRNDDTYASPVVAGNAVMFGIDVLVDRPTDHGSLVALDTRTGALRWRFDPVRYHGTGSGISATPAFDEHNGLIFVGTGNPTPIGSPPPGPDPYSESILALDLHNGKLRWAYGPVHPHDVEDRDFFASPNLFSIEGHQVVGEGNKDGTYYVVDAQTGRAVWRRAVVPHAPYALIVGTAAVARGRIVVPVYQNDGLGWLVVLDAQSGRVFWRKRLHGLYEAPLVWGSTIFVTQSDGTLEALRLRNGTSLAKLVVGKPLHGRGPSAVGNRLFVAAGARLRSFTISAS